MLESNSCFGFRRNFQIESVTKILNYQEQNWNLSSKVCSYYSRLISKLFSLTEIFPAIDKYTEAMYNKRQDPFIDSPSIYVGLLLEVH